MGFSVAGILCSLKNWAAAVTDVFVSRVPLQVMVLATLPTAAFRDFDSLGCGAFAAVLVMWVCLKIVYPIVPNG